MHIRELEDAGIIILTGAKICQSPGGKFQIGSIDRSFLCFASQGKRRVSNYDLVHSCDPPLS
jgi:hypothetical protein